MRKLNRKSQNIEGDSLMFLFYIFVVRIAFTFFLFVFKEKKKSEENLPSSNASALRHLMSSLCPVNMKAVAFEILLKKA